MSATAEKNSLLNKDFQLTYKNNTSNKYLANIYNYYFYKHFNEQIVHFFIFFIGI